MKSELLLKFVFEASHSLTNYEVPHPHLWKLEIALIGNPIDGRIVDMVSLRERFRKVVDGLAKTYLNENSRVGEKVRQFPTCETLSHYFYQEFQDLVVAEFIPYNPSVRISSVMIGICDLEGGELGAVKLYQD